MRFYLFVLFLFTVILLTHPPRVGSGRMKRETVYEWYDQDSVDEVRWKLKSDSLNKTR